MSASKPPLPLSDVRCPACNKLLLRAFLVKGSVIEPFCEKCKAKRLIIAA